MRLRRGFDLDPSCKLWLPFYKYGSEQSKIWDQSGNNNHGVITGAVPYPGNPQMTSVGSTYNYGDFTPDNAFFWSSLNLSPLAGTDLGFTSHRIVVVDGAGKLATGYLAGVGAGETLGSELITSWSSPGIYGGSAYDTFTTSGKDITSAIKTLGAGDYRASSNNGWNTIIHALYKYVVNLTLNSGERPKRYVVSGDAGQYLLTNDYIPDGETIYYFNEKVSGNFGFCSHSNSNDTDWSTTDTLKRVTDPPSTGLHIVSSLNGTTRAWKSVESGFNPNTITSWRIDA